MSGYGGNLTYPSTKIFINNIGNLSSPGTDGQEIRIANDAVLAPGGKVLFFENYGESIPSVNGSFTRVDHKDAVSRSVKLELNQLAPCDECNAELGFTVVAKAQHPGVFNDNVYGQRRTYAHKFNRLDPVLAGYLSDEDLMKAYADICQQITDDTGRYNGSLQGNIESVVDSVVSLTFDATVASGTFDVPAAGLYGKTLAQCADYIDSAGTTTITNTGGSVTIPGYGFIVHVPGAQEITDHSITLTTKSEYKSKVTFVLEKFDGKKSVIAEGNFELLPWEEVFREFTHMAHDAPLSNHHYVEKPTNDQPWSKFIIESNMGNAAIHGASHGDTYKQQVILFVSGTTPNINSLNALLTAWLA